MSQIQSPTKKKKPVSDDSIRKLLRDKYLYSDEHFSTRIETLDKRTFEDCAISEAFSLTTRGGKPFLLAIACEASSLSKTLEQASKHIAATETIGLLALAPNDSSRVEFYRRRFDSNKFDRIPDLEYYFKGAVGAQSVLLEETPEYRVAADHSPDIDLLPLSNKLENLFFEIHSCMRDIDGVHADMALEELCKLIYVKAFIEEQANSIPESPVHSREFGSTEEYAATVRGLYRDSIDYDLRVFRLKIPQYDRSRGVFQEPIRLSSAALVKSFQLLENYSLTKSKADVKGRAFQKVLGRAIRSGMGQYFTPGGICELMTHVIKPHVRHLILDPFCGSGHFLTLCLAAVAKETPTTSKEFHEFAFGKLHGIEKSDRMTRIAMTDMRLSGDGHSNIRCADALLDFDNYPDIAPNSFDIVLTNPPFGSLLGPEALAQLGSFELARGRKTVALEILGLERAIAFLRPGGRLAIVLPESIFSADSTSYVREWLKTKVKVRAIVSLPIETFSPFGANVKTGILFARKWKSGEIVSASHKVCMLKIDAVGYDPSGRSKAENDLGEATTTLEQFVNAEGW